MSKNTEETELQSNFYVGVTLAISSTILIGTSFVIKKSALKRSQERGEISAGAGGHGYLRDFGWWIVGLGEVLNFIAYMFAPAQVVTPLGGLSVLVSAVLASKCLHEKLNIFGKLGCVLCIIGSIILIVHAPQIEEITRFDDLATDLHFKNVVIYLVAVFLIFIIIRHFLTPKNGKLILYLFICSFIGALTVLVCKTLGLILKDSIVLNKTTTQLPIGFILINILIILVFIFIQIHYLNRVLDLFSTGIVTPIYYVMFSTMVTITTALIFGVCNFSILNFLGSVCGFLILVVAIVMLSYFNSDNYGVVYNESLESLIYSSLHNEPNA